MLAEVTVTPGVPGKLTSEVTSLDLLFKATQGWAGARLYVMARELLVGDLSPLWIAIS